MFKNNKQQHNQDHKYILVFQLSLYIWSTYYCLLPTVQLFCNFLSAILNLVLKL